MERSIILKGMELYFLNFLKLFCNKYFGSGGRHATANVKESEDNSLGFVSSCFRD